VTFHAINVPGATFTAAWGINNSDLIVGFYLTVVSGQTQKHGFLFDGIAFTTISFPGSNRTEALGINDTGQIVGTYEDGTTAHGFLYDAGLFTTIDFPGAPLTNLFAINDLGQLAGAYDNAASTLRHSFVGSSGHLMPLISPPTYSNALGINDAGQVVGFSIGSNLNSFFASPSAGPPSGIPEPSTIAVWTGMILAGFYRWGDLNERLKRHGSGQD
jgi:probable HAF family extracellular repeat protein